MSDKFIGEMSYEEFLDALKIILSKDEPQEKEKKLTFIEFIKEEITETIDAFKYIFSTEMIKDVCSKLRYIFSKQFLTDCKNKIESIFQKEEEKPLTKEEFIIKGKKFKAALKETIDTVIFVIVMVIIIRFFLGEIRWIPSGSMRPTLIEGDRIFVERYSRFYKTPQRGDIMVFYPPFEKLKNTPVKVFSRLTGFFCKDIAYIKRVIGMPGDKFEVKWDDTGKYTIYINDKPLDEPYIRSAYDYTTCTEAMTCGPLIIPEKHYMMLGDNRGNSQDGRYWGLLSEDRFIGKAVFLFWPFSRVKSLKLKVSPYGNLNE